MLNSVDFALRKSLRFKRNAWPQHPLGEAGVEAFYQQWQDTPLLQTLLQQYPLLKQWASQLDESTLCENLNSLVLFEVARSQIKPFNQPISVLEVGIKNWTTLPALMAFATALAPQQHTQLLGVEIDVWRTFASGYSRFDQLSAMAQQGKVLAQQAELNTSINWAEGDMTGLDTAPFDIVVCQLPFVFEHPHTKWGLPQHTFNPQGFFAHLCQCLKPNGLLIISNQGALEAEEQGRLLSPLPLQLLTPPDAIKQPFVALKHPRYASLWQKTP